MLYTKKETIIQQTKSNEKEWMKKDGGIMQKITTIKKSKHHNHQCEYGKHGSSCMVRF